MFRFALLAAPLLATTIACGAPQPPPVTARDAPHAAIDPGADDVASPDAPGDVGDPDEEPDEPDEPAEPACEPDVVCIEELPFLAEGTTVGGSDRFDTYACGAQDESGPERIYRVTLPTAGSLVVELDDALEDTDADVDVHILTELDANECIARGDRRAFANVSGVVYVALDTFVFADGTEGAGAFAASFVFTPAVDVGGDAVALALANAGVPEDVASLAALAWANADVQDLTDSSVYSVIDFSRPSHEKRLWIVDVATGALLVHDRVTHGIGSNSASDPAMADAFSNTPGSNQSSLGLARTAETYEGSNGYSLRLDGLEASNDNMRDRAIVMHGAAYAEDSFVEDNGYLGRSNGCPAVAMSRSADVIDIVKEGTLVFSYFPDADWLETSAFLQ